MAAVFVSPGDSSDTPAVAEAVLAAVSTSEGVGVVDVIISEVLVALTELVLLTVLNERLGEDRELSGFR